VAHGHEICYYTSGIQMLYGASWTTNPATYSMPGRYSFTCCLLRAPPT